MNPGLMTNITHSDPGRNNVIVLGDVNTKIGRDKTSLEDIMEQQSLRENKHNEERLA